MIQTVKPTKATNVGFRPEDIFEKSLFVKIEKIMYTVG